MVFDTSVLETRVFGLIRNNKLDASIQFIDTLKFPTKSPNKDVTFALDQLFKDVKDTAEVFGVDLTVARGTFAVNARDSRLYEPSIGSHQGKAVINWGTQLFPLDELFTSEEAHVTIGQEDKGFVLVCDRNGQRGVLKLWTKKGKQYTKSQLQVKLGSAESFGSVLEPVKVPTIPLLQLKKYIGKTLYVKSLKVSEGGKFGATGAIEFYNIPGYYRGNANAIGKLLRGYMGEEKEEYTWQLEKHEFKPLEVRSGQLGDYLHYECLDLSEVDEEEEWEYSEDEPMDGLGVALPDEDDDFSMEDEAE